MARIYTTFAEFWPFYLREHSFAADAVLEAAARALVLFNDQFGHYPYRSLVIAVGRIIDSAALVHIV